ncbi:SH3 domain-containing protein [Streptomyces rhizosphaerihabitans]|uniref:SH3 domain-containing protein n=1 Tax=Streptomyces rhizosphaerihabitans TaxID=1266770 RepID=UPI0021C15100|nr:SH3 domain-containing protein [Streptomyces rhizosphaerihabitans]MCT9008165.1 SH3 domain-containing protein [Streptomyces rhizosphaerihabitans]
MRTTPALRTLAAALLSGGVLTVAAAGTSMAAVPSAHTGDGGGSGSPVWGTVVSRGELNLRLQPSTGSPVVGALSPGSQDRVECSVRGQSVSGDTSWYWLVGAHAWASAAFVDTGGRWVPSCSDPCPDQKDGVWHNAHWDNNRNPADDPGWSVTASGSWTFTVSSAWSWTVSGSSSNSWDWVPGGR